MQYLLDDLMDDSDLFAQPSMEIWPASRLHRGFFHRQLPDLHREMQRLFDWTDKRLETLDNENAEQKVKVIEDGEKEFKLNLACKDFKPEDIKCEIQGHYLSVEGKSKYETKDEKSMKHWVRKVLLPENAELNDLECVFKPDGKLQITIPKKQLAIDQAPNTKIIPIKHE
jgi:HSP20 family molecular chaperone IbpA